MNDDPEDLEVEIDQEEAEAPSPPPPVDDDSDIAELRRQLEQERTLRVQAQKMADEANQRAHTATAEKDDTDLQLVSNAIDTLSANQSVLRSDYQIAMERQDFAAAADIQQAMSENSAKLLQLENGREAMSRKPKADAPAPVLVDPVDDLAGRLTAKSAAWVRQHPEVATDQRLTRKMVRAHQDALDDGLVAETPEYFAYVENRLGIGTRDDKPTEGAQMVQRRDTAPAPAPVSRGGGGKNVIRLTAEQREVAAMNKMTDQEYAAQVLRMRNENERKH